MAELLGVEVEEGEEVYLGGVGGRIKGYVHRLWMRVGEKRMRVPVVFSREFVVSFNLIGRKGIFDKLVITFDEAKKRVVVEDGGS